MYIRVCVQQTFNLLDLELLYLCVNTLVEGLLQYIRICCFYIALGSTFENCISI